MIRVIVSILLATLLTPLFLTAQGQAQFRPLYLSGKVVLEDGSPPPVPAVVELWCGGQRQPQEYTDNKGGFNFRVGGDQSRAIADSQRTIPGAAVGARGPDRSFVSLTDCELIASLSGYTSTKINLGRRSVFESPDVGTLVLHPLSKGTGTFISMNTMSAPEKARKSYQKAEKELSKKKPNRQKAAEDLEKAVELYPQFAAAWNQLGEARVAEGDLQGAREAFQKAMDSDPKFVPPCLSLALIGLQQQRMADAAAMAQRVLKLLPELPEAHYYNAVASLSLGNFEGAEASIRMVQASSQANKYPRTHFMLGNILIQKGDIAGAAAELRRYIELEPSSKAAEAAQRQLAQWKAAGRLN